jgi:formylglycine-generating enzyme required for sulfatase activity
MRKDILWLIIIVIFAVSLSACNTQQSESPFQTEQTSTQLPTTTDSILPTNTPDATPTFTPEPTSIPNQTEATPLPTETITPTAIATEQPSMGSTRISDVDQMVQVYVPAGEFIMGSDDIEAQTSLTNGRAYPEIPVHTVYLDGYWIDKYEVTTSQYALCVDAGVCLAPHGVTPDIRLQSRTRLHYFDNPEYANYPVIWVNWDMALAYCEWVGRRLPTEAEWEKAARGTDGRKYPWGNEPVSGELVNFCDVNCPTNDANELYDDGYADTSPVGSYPAGASPYGALDMSGNVWEWVSTIIRPYPYDPNDGREDPELYAERVWRGGPWSNGYWWQRSSVRYRSVPFYANDNLGFRCASSP